MVTKDRLAEMKSKSRRSKTEKVPIEVFNKAIDQIKHDIDQVESNTREIKSLQIKIKNSFHTDGDDLKRLEVLKSETQNLAIVSQKALTSEKQKIYLNSPYYDMKINMINSQLERIKTIWEEYLQILNNHKDESKRKLEKQWKIKFGDQELPSHEDLISNQNGFVLSYLDDTGNAKAQLSELTERFESLKKIEQEILEVNKLFQQVSILIMHQGEKIDVIQTTIKEAEFNTENAKKELETAEKKKRKKRKMKIVLTTCGTAVAGIVLLVCFL